MLGMCGRMVGIENQWLDGFRPALFIFLEDTMEKLIELLNEYLSKQGLNRVEEYSSYFDFFYQERWGRIESETIISKKFWFIQWLVEKRKVERFLIPEIIKEVEVDSSGLHDYNRYYEDWESLLMYLSIQEDPISFLVSILK